MAARALLSSRIAGVCGAKVVASCGRRTYSAAAAAAARKEPVGAAGEARRPGAGAKPKVEEGFWMRDPKTGCWMPENHRLHDVDAADLRARLLFAKKD
ncbi:hypothetical protein C2845_PM13G18980 [Panicum miliaceum]|uniref:Protein SENESCENCE-ASSOCIATED GENE 21, mitochondrial-like n=1 Tax=Panicum miliaceum TaxID=4540 RepID=A0A3L6RFN6_PANMI|nr:hypothetical protein C2845_PM13G18980 [Panicum miliaceum]